VVFGASFLVLLIPYSSRNVVVGEQNSLQPCCKSTSLQFPRIFLESGPLSDIKTSVNVIKEVGLILKTTRALQTRVFAAELALFAISGVQFGTDILG
jgi:hypothetical protein